MAARPRLVERRGCLLRRRALRRCAQGAAASPPCVRAIASGTTAAAIARWMPWASGALHTTGVAVVSALCKGERPEKNLPAQKARRFFGAPAGISPDGDKLRLPGSDQKKLPAKRRGVFWCSSGDSNPNRITHFQCLSLSDNTFDNFLLRFTYRLTLLCTCCLRLSSRSV